ncbi:MAG: hypothetical protein ACRETO_10345 [Gammaproteobacteria bacterium]
MNRFDNFCQIKMWHFKTKLARTVLSIVFVANSMMAWAQNEQDKKGPIVAHLAPVSPSIFGNASLNIEENELPALAIKAMTGSGKAAIRLADFYGFVKLDYKKQRYWYQIAVENDDLIAMYNYAIILSQTGNPNDKVRSHFWMEKAASEGYKAAQEYLKDNP